MNIYDLEQRSADELIRGYYHDETEGFICLQCDEFSCIKEEEMQKHIEDVHSSEREQRFLKIINFDDALDLSAKEKNFYTARFLGMSDAEIAASIGMTPSTVRSHQFLLRKKVLKAKLTLMLWDMLMPKELKEDKKRKSKKSEKPSPDERIPGLDNKGLVCGFYTKDEVHNPAKPIHHASVILLVAQQGTDGQFRFLVCTKSSKMLTISGDISAIGKSCLDVIGGHVEEGDSLWVKIGSPLPAEVFLGAAAREFKEEVHIKSAKPVSFQPENLVYLCSDESALPLYPNRFNIETSQVFLALLPANITKANILVRDEWTDSWGVAVKRKYPSQLLTWDELNAIPESDDTFLMDGAQRLVDHMREEPSLKERMFELLKNMKPII